MSSFQVRVTTGRVGFLLQRLNKMEGFRTGAKAAFVHLKSKLAVYPPRSSRPQALYWNEKTRKGFFYHLNKGNIDVPWRRGLSPNSERLGQRWQVEGEGFGLRLRNRASYAGRVQGREQTLYHKATGWKRTDKVIAEERRPMQAIMMSGVKQDLKP